MGGVNRNSWNVFHGIEYKRNEKTGVSSLSGWVWTKENLQNVGQWKWHLWGNLLNEHFKTERNLTYERHQFWSRVQEYWESTVTYITALKNLAYTCEFNEYSADKAVIDQTYWKMFIATS